MFAGTRNCMSVGTQVFISRIILWVGSRRAAAGVKQTKEKGKRKEEI